MLVDRTPTGRRIVPLIRMKTSSRCHLSPGRGRRRRSWFASAYPTRAPGPDRLVADHDTTRKHHLLDLAKAQREPVIEPHAVGDDLRRVPGVPCTTTMQRSRPPILAATRQRANLTVPFRRLCTSIPCNCATSAAWRVAAYGAFGDNWAANQLSKADALGESLALRFTPGFQARSTPPSHHHQTLPQNLLQAIAEGRYNDYNRRIRVQPDSKPTSAKQAPNASLMVLTGSFAIVELLYRNWAFDVASICRRVHMWQGWMIDL